MIISNSVPGALILLGVTIEIAGIPFGTLHLGTSKTFRCTDGKYIANNLFCSSKDIIYFNPKYEEVVCEDGSHESFGCDREKCRGRFKCNDGSCVDIDTRCNTKTDCKDGSDELHCGDEVNVGNCSLADGKFLCHDGLRCLDLEYTCDGGCNCFDCSDENMNCTIRGDNEMIKKCPHHYFSTPNGPKCFCDSNDNRMKNLCREVKPCSNDKADICAQKCSQYKNKITCSCFEKYNPVYTKLGFKCLSDVYYNNLLVYSTTNRMKVANLTSGHTAVIMKNIQFAVVAGAHDYIYYTAFDDDRKTISRVSISTGETTRLFESNSSIVSIAVDYFTNNVYLTTNTSLWVCSTEKEHCLELKCCNVRYVALAPKSGLMFYMKKADFQDERFIMKSEMDGSNEEYLVDGGFRHYSSLAVDESNRKIYWAQYEENEIWCLSFDHAHNKLLSSLKYHGVLMHFTVLDSQLLFTKVRDNEIYKIDSVERYTRTVKNDQNDELYWSPTSGIVDTDKMLTDPRFGSIYMGYSVVPAPLSDKNATRLIDYNITFAIKYLHAYNPTFQNTTKNACADASCDALCFVSYSISEGYVCKDIKGQIGSGDGVAVWRNITSNTAVKSSSSVRENKLSKSSEQSKNDWSFLITSLVVVALVVVVLAGVYFKFSRGSWFGYRGGLTNLKWNRSRADDGVVILNRADP